jgi:hypothetical protein
MDYVTINLTPGRFFCNLQFNDVAHKLEEIGYSLVYERSDFVLYRNASLDSIKVRKDGGIYFKTVVAIFDDNLLEKLFNRINTVINALNSVYGNLLDLSNMFIYWPKNYKLDTLSIGDFVIQNEDVHDFTCSSIMRKKYNYCL